MRRSSIFIALAIIGFISLTGAYAQSADDIIKASRERVQAETVSTRARMLIRAKDGSITERLVDQYSSKKEGRLRTVVVFQKPASVAGSRFLTIENPNGSEDRWIYLPSLGKVRRIAATEGSGSFMGTDLSYDDLSSTDRDTDADTHIKLPDGVAAGKAAWVIESTPKTPYQYSKVISYIDKSNNTPIKMELYDKKGKLLKVMEMGKYQDIQGRLTSLSYTMSNVQEQTATTVNVEIMRYDDPIPDSVFTTRYLETGRP